ncbi:DUF5597 domain-containing protein [Gluconacetobacter asukensis]|uniref:DUF5597 domain-containing protein n=1 Tax=Gluconacetobacter asukensis TaxID=1017181 RepID=A0A7W4J2U7_9PROT|nr:DUF5597 domain-containing protein [Gluconacetobacter asukensis]MBB2173617.1 DUF5597 domain-containing protein [Gluconacetobacter asukensis]
MRGPIVGSRATGRVARGFAVLAFVLVGAVGAGASASPMPRLVGGGGHFQLEVDGRPFFVLAAQMHNSSAWPSTLPAFFRVAERLHVNTVQAPVYWETLEAEPGRFDFSGVDALIDGARAHHVRLALLWFGTWKNGAGHYVPLWMKRDPARYPRLLDADRQPLDGMSPFGTATLERDRSAFAALMGHLKAYDADRHTVIMVQVENEPGLLGTVRDHGAAADAAFAAAVPDAVLKATGRAPGTWGVVFGADAAEAFSAWAVSRYVESVAEAGRAVYPLPLYVNVWLRYRGLTHPGFEYPSGGGTANVLDIWKSQTHAIDVLGTDSYTESLAEFHAGVLPYQRRDNAPWLSESGITVASTRWTYDLLARGGIGASVFGVDDPGHDPAVAAHGLDNALFEPLLPVLLDRAAKGDVAALLQEPAVPSPTRAFGNWTVRGSFGAHWGEGDPPETPLDATNAGRALVARLDATHFLVAGRSVRVSFLPRSAAPGVHEVERVEEGIVDAQGCWRMTRLWNGDETDYGLALPAEGAVLRVEVTP